MPITPGGRVSPNAGDDFDLVTDLAAMQVSNEAATAAEIAAAVSGIAIPRRNYLVDVNSVRLGLSGANLYEGLRFYATDTNLDWFYDGTKWIQHDTGWVNLTVGSGWSGAGVGFEPQARRIGNMVHIRGAVALGNGGSYGTVVILPTGMRPTAPRFLGAMVASAAGALGQYQVQAGGPLSIVYTTGTTPLGMVVPLVGSFGVNS